VQVAAVVHIGKEADKWEEQFYTGFDEAAQIEYRADASGEALDQRILVMCEELGEREAARRLSIATLGGLRGMVEHGQQAQLKVSWDRPNADIARRNSFALIGIGAPSSVP
jgi:hypothetical protein